MVPSSGQITGINMQTGLPIVGNIVSFRYVETEQRFYLKLDQKGVIYEFPFEIGFFPDAEVQFLDETIGVGSQISFVPKKLADLEVEGWFKNKKGRYIKRGGNYEVGREKSKILGQIIKGTVHLSSEGIPYIRYNNWRFSPDMIKYVYAQVIPKVCQAEVGMVRKLPDGKVMLSSGETLDITSRLRLARSLLEF